MNTPTKLPRQELIFVENWNNDRSIPRALPIPMSSNERPTRLWTLFMYTEKNYPPTLPFVPQHRLNAFLEDWSHDYVIEKKTLRYHSRIAYCPVWILLEFGE